MPELPEVERARRIIEAIVVGRTIDKVWCDTSDDIVFAGVSGRTVARRLKGRRVVAAHRRGKQLWCELDRPPHLLLHLGMTGQILAPESGPLRLASSPKDLTHAWPPRFTKIRLWLSDGGELAMTNARRLGRIRLQDDPRREPPVAKLGFDPLYEMPSRADFSARLRKRKGLLKAVLLDQSFAAGVGNWIADEVLYQAGIDPRRRGTSLSDAEAGRLHAKLAAVIRRACEVDADKERLPKSWLFHHRWGKVADAKTSRGEAIEHLTIAGRTTAWVPSRQK
ncbi:MAG: DNA-formamidopyrimidine glycosylase family protein [Myxococcota bacterium]